MPHGLVERSPGPSEQECPLQFHMCTLWSELHGIRKCQPQILLKGLLSGVPQEGGESRMTDELFRRIKAYRETLTLARRMLEAGLISRKEFLMIEDRTAKKHGLSKRSIFREIT